MLNKFLQGTAKICYRRNIQINIPHYEDLCLKYHYPIQTIQTRKSSCVKARGIPTAAYEVLHMLYYPGGGGRYLGRGGGGGVGTLARGLGTLAGGGG